jgi:hypothetical protein
VVDVDEEALAASAAWREPAIVIVSAGRDSRDTQRLGNWIEWFDLRSLDGRPARSPRPSDRYGIFRVPSPES